MDDLIVSLAGFVRIRLQSVGNVGVCLVDVDIVEKVMIHEITIALVVVTGEAFVLVEVDAVNLGEIQIAVLIGSDEVFVKADGGGTGCQTQGAARIQGDNGSHDVGCLSAHIVVIFCFDDSHSNLPLWTLVYAVFIVYHGCKKCKQTCGHFRTKNFHFRIGKARRNPR